jgi:hypothetical protein
MRSSGGSLPAHLGSDSLWMNRTGSPTGILGVSSKGSLGTVAIAVCRAIVWAETAVISCWIVRLQ